MNNLGSPAMLSAVCIKEEVSSDAQAWPNVAESISKGEIANLFAIGCHTSTGALREAIVKEEKDYDSAARQGDEIEILVKVVAGLQNNEQEADDKTGDDQSFFAVQEKAKSQNFALEPQPSDMENRCRKKRHACAECGKTFFSKSNLTQHCYIHTSEFECDVCGKRFHSGAHLRQHTRIHTGEKPYKCAECGKEFAGKHNLLSHFRTHTGEKPFECKVCGKRFGASLSLHTRFHSGEKPYKCTQCGRRFSQMGHLKDHHQIHIGNDVRTDGKQSAMAFFKNNSGKKRYVCAECKKEFSTRYDLRKHQFSHTGAKQPECDVCGKQFVNKYSLIRHTRIHSGEKPCKSAERQFSGQRNLAKHQLVHTGEKPFECDACGKQFGSGSGLNKHKRTRLGGWGACGPSLKRRNSSNSTAFERANKPCPLPN